MTDDEPPIPFDPFSQTGDTKKDFTQYGPNPKAQAARRKKHYSELAARRQSGRVRRLLRAGGLLLILVAAVVAATLFYKNPWRNTFTTAPDSVRGVWVTSEDEYQGRSVVILEDAIIIGSGNDESARYRINRVRMVATKEDTLFVFETTDLDGVDLEYAVYYSDDDRIRFQYRPDVTWVRKTSTAGWPISP